VPSRGPTPAGDLELRAELVQLLDGGGAHARAEDVLARVEPAMRGVRPPGLAHSPWELLEHLRVAQEDILEWSFDPEYQSPPWPEGAKAWDRSVAAFLRDLRRALRIARDRKLDLFAPLEHSKDATLLGELFLIASHNSYHLAQMVDAARALESEASIPAAKRGRRASKR
jgi:hypothetical protein